MWNKRFSKDDNSFMISCVPSIALLITAFYAGRHNTTPQKNVILIRLHTSRTHRQDEHTAYHCGFRRSRGKRTSMACAVSFLANCGIQPVSQTGRRVPYRGSIDPSRAGGQPGLVSCRYR